MPGPTFNKYRSTTIYGALNVKDFTNSAGTSVIEQASVDLSGNFLSRGDSTFTKAIVCNANVADINANNKLTTKEYVDSAVSGGGGSSILGLNNAWSGTNSYNVYFPSSTLPTSTSITSNSIVNKGMLDTIYQSISGMSSYLTTSSASSTYQTLAGMSSYLTTSSASSTYQTIADMTNYLTTSSASSTYQTLAGMSSYLTTSSASSTYQTIANMTNYLTSTQIASTYQTIANSVSLSANNTFSGKYNIFNGYLFNQYSSTNFFRNAYGDTSTTTGFTLSPQQSSTGSSVSINQTSITNSTTTSGLSQTLITSYTLPAYFSKGITLNIPVGMRTGGAWVVGTTLACDITHTFNTITPKLYVNGTFITNLTYSVNNNNPLTRTFNIGYVNAAGNKTVSIDQYFFNLTINTSDYFNDYLNRNEGQTNAITIKIEYNVLSTITKTSNSGNFTASLLPSIISNITTLTFVDNSSPVGNFTSVNNGAGGTSATSIQVGNDMTAGTTYINNLRCKELSTNLNCNNGTTTSSLRVSHGDYPYIYSILLAKPVYYTTPQVYTETIVQRVQGTTLTINQTTTTATITEDYNVPISIIAPFSIPQYFSKSINVGIPIGIENTGNHNLTGTALTTTIQNTINSMTCKVYINGVYTNINLPVVILNSNVSSRTNTIAYTTTGNKYFSMEQFYFDIAMEGANYYNNYLSRDESKTNIIELYLSANITTTFTKTSNTGNFTATNYVRFVSNTNIQTYSTGSSVPVITPTFSPNSNGTNYFAFSTASVYNDPNNFSGGTTYTNHLRANTFNLIRAGTILLQAHQNIVPTGFLLCNGATLNATTNPQYQELYNYITILYGGTSQASFNVPNLTAPNANMVYMIKY